MELPESIILLDSLGDLQVSNNCPILVCGSHCGGNRNLARQVKNCHIRAVFLNNAGVGKNKAGTRGLTHYEAENIIACAVDNYSAEIGIAQDTWDSGIISHINHQAVKAGIQIGDSVQEAVAKTSSIIKSPSQKIKAIESTNELEVKSSKVDLKKQTQVKIDDQTITVTDSITFLNENNSGDIVVCGSHGGLSAGAYAKKHKVKAVFFNDAGIGKNKAGIKSLIPLNEAGILACTIDCLSAEIFNGQDALVNGIISDCNLQAKVQGIKEKMTVKEAIKHLA